HLGEHTIDFFGEGVKWKRSGNSNSRRLLRWSRRRLHQNESRCPVKPPTIRLLTVLKDRFQVAPFIEAFSELALIQTARFGEPFKCTRIQSRSFAEQAIMHGPILPLCAGTARRHCCLYADTPIGSRIVAVHKLDLPGVDVGGLQLG